MSSESRTYVPLLVRVRPHERLESATVDELVDARTRVEQILGDRSVRLRAQPALDRPIEEADLRLVDDPVGHEAARRDLEDVLRPRETVELERRAGSSRRSSTSWWSRNGTRTSSECAMEARSK